MDIIRDDAQVDVLIVGAGITGLSAAYHLPSNTRTLIVEAEGLPSAASVASTGMLVDSIEEDVCDVQDGSRAFVQYVRAGIRDILACIDAHGIACDLTRTDALYLASKAGHVPQLRAECVAKHALGDDATLLLGDEVRKHIDVPAPAALLLRDTYHFDAGAFCAGLADHLARHGVRICINSPVLSIDHATRTARINGCAIKYGKIIITSPIEDDALAAIRKNLIGVRSYVLATSELSASDFDAHWRQRGMFWTSDEPIYRYGKMDKDGRIVFGGNDSFIAGEPVPSDAGHAALEKRFRKTFPAFKDAPVEQRWSGTITFFPDRMPLVGQISDDLFVALGTVGLPIGFRNGWLINELMQGHAPPAARILSPTRRVPITRIHYLLLRHAPFAWVVNKYLSW